MRRTIGTLATAMLLIGSVSSALAQQRSPRPNDPYVADQWNLKAVGAFSAWSNTRGRGAKIAIVDSGVDLRHPDLRKNIVSSGADFIDPDGRDAAQDEHGHGTHVAGIAAAIANNGIGVAGVAPKSRILPVRVLDETNSGSTSGVADGVRYAANKGADVINLSLSSQPGAGEVLSVLDDPVGEAIDYAWEQGAVVVVAAGNTPGWPLCQEPASSAVAVCVGGVDPELNSLFWSRDATLTTTHLVAPAGDPFQVGPDRGDCTRGITSTWLRRAQRGNPCSPADDGYERASGTSMAAPVVSGVAALLSSQGLDNEAIVERLISTAQDLGASGRDPVFGYGLVDAAAAVSAPN